MKLKKYIYIEQVFLQISSQKVPELGSENSQIGKRQVRSSLMDFQNLRPLQSIFYSHIDHINN